MGKLVIQEKPQKRFRWQWVVDPRVAMWVAYWDLVTSLCLLFTATVTPYEVAFLQPPPHDGKWQDSLFLTNRVIDAIFILDMIIQFRVAFRTAGSEVRWEYSPRKIAVNYICSKWFWIDLFAVLTLLFDVVGDGDTQNLTVLRAVRALRLAKLVRLLRGSRIFKAWEMRLSINYAYLELFSVTCLIVFIAHWWACVWGLQASFFPLDSWPAGKEYCVPWLEVEGVEEAVATQLLRNGSCPSQHPSQATMRPVCSVGECNDGICTGGSLCVDHWPMYAYSIYFAVMTVTSVGYGDVVATAFNPFEQVLCAIIMLVSGMIWGYLIGTFCGLAASLSPVVKSFREDLSSLNHFMRLHHLPPETRIRMREYFHQTIHLRHVEVQNRLLAHLSPAMQAEVSFIVNSRWVDQVWYLRAVSHVNQQHTTTLRIELASRLSPFVFPPGEFTPVGFMYIIERGTALWAGKMLREAQGHRSVWGDDIILGATSKLQLNFPALAATYLQVFAIDSVHMLSVLQKFPDVMRPISHICSRWIMRRGFVRAAERIVYTEGGHFRGRLRPIYARELLGATSSADERNRATAGPGFLQSKSFLALPQRGRTRMLPHNMHKSHGTMRQILGSGADLLRNRKPRGRVTYLSSGLSLLEASVSRAWLRPKKQSTIGKALGHGSVEDHREKIKHKKRKASVAHAATTFGLDEMKTNMQARIAAEESSDVRIGRLEDKLNLVMGNLERIESLLQRGSAHEGSTTSVPRMATASTTTTVASSSTSSPKGLGGSAALGPPEDIPPPSTPPPAGCWGATSLFAA